MNLGKISGLPPDFVAKVKAQHWMERLHALRAGSEIRCSPLHVHRQVIYNI